MLTFWTIVTVAAVVVEIITLGNLICIWFAVGSLASLALAALNLSLPLQIIAFFVVSIIAMLVIRPLAYNYLRGNTVPTNSDRLIGKKAILTKGITEGDWGELKLDGALWSAVTADGTEIEKGKLVKIIAIDGSKLIVIAYR